MRDDEPDTDTEAEAEAEAEAEDHSAAFVDFSLYMRSQPRERIKGLKLGHPLSVRRRRWIRVFGR